MPLADHPNVPHAPCGEVVAVNGARVWPVLAGDRVDLFLAHAGDHMRAELDAAAVAALRDLLDDASARMAAG